jgi:metal-responsive CopG/Arc/MetJ family transcriptional regulator
MPPRKDVKPMEQVSLPLPQELIKEIDCLASTMGLGRNEILRQLISEGMPLLYSRDTARLERENRLLVNAKLKRRTEPIQEAIGKLEASGENPEVLALLKESIGP